MKYNEKTLYISDLDGTLLNSKGKVSGYSKKHLNELIDKGINFSVATARTPATVVDLLEGININWPVVVMNGASIYEMKTNRYLNIKYIEETAVEKMLIMLEAYKQNAFIYCIKDNHIYTYYSNLENKVQEAFYKERKDNSRKTFMCGKKPKDMRVVYFVLIDTESRIKELYEQIQGIEGISGVAYKDVYLEDSYYLEVYQNNVSKAQAIKEIKTKYTFNRIICFGDNLNDIPMFEMSHEAYAVNNAKQEVKAMATGIIKSNDEDGVVRHILKE